MWGQVLVEFLIVIIVLSAGAWNIGQGIKEYKKGKFSAITFGFGIYSLIIGVVFVIVNTLESLGVLNVSLW